MTVKAALLQVIDSLLSTTIISTCQWIHSYILFGMLPVPDSHSQCRNNNPVKMVIIMTLFYLLKPELLDLFC